MTGPPLDKYSSKLHKVCDKFLARGAAVQRRADCRRRSATDGSQTVAQINVQKTFCCFEQKLWNFELASFLLSQIES